ncbi:MAG: TlpA disulfide reductase family protein [Candidatus Pedobacter colombiensis]|uniref:TlpA disulfide reductase family protein n=1 Tax=Candidatus Pedobacter colombiensis TaxID=3121371 RepID=A0AAJ5W8W3_9SPHI|nr:TlpA disulfide reductase family protein [Pedobacter sp.]WEK20226.1 MAG: TlpA disulfide reductase family protein [Pedobacter sp.]
MTKIIKLKLFCIFSLLSLFSSKQSFGITIDTPTIIAGKSKITGRIISPNDTNKNNIFVNITVSQPISGEFVKYKSFVDQSGKFSIDVDVETAISLISLNTSLNPVKYLLIKLTSGGITNLDIAYNSDNEIKNIDVTPAMNQNDMTQGFEVMNKMIEYRSGRTLEPLYNKSTDYFLNYAKTAISERLEIVNNDTSISKELKGVLSKDFRLFQYVGFVFDYKKYMMLNYHNTNDDKSKNPDIQKIDRSYYHFLKDFNLNDPQYLNCFTFQEFQKEILQNEILGLPVIGESDIPFWLANAKVILSDLVGFDNGPYYDILAANAYARQLTEEVRPLTEKQKENIVNYWKKGEIAKILFRKNQQVVDLDKFKSPAVVNDISLVSEDKVIEAIVSKHKGKVVFIDLWATWCTPCLDAMQQFRSTKNEFRDKDVAFVYITNGSSPRKLWEEKIKGIGNEHYYLTGAQWEYIMNHFKFEGIPSYLLYNKKGALINKFTAFPGNDKVKGMINGLL